MVEAANDSHDPTVYRVEDDVGEHELQTYILEVLRPLLEAFVRAQGAVAHVGSDQSIYWKQHDPQACVAPDIYVLPGVPQDIAIDVWKVWERGVVPSFALEVVGGDKHKDYEEAPRRYAELGVQELVVFDPFDGPGRVAFALYRRRGESLQRVQTTSEDRVFSEQLGCHLRRIGRHGETRLRVATGPRGDDLLPTDAEARDAERAAKEAERAAKEAERDAKEAERAAKEAEREAKEREKAAKEAALRRVAELEAKLAERDG